MTEPVDAVPASDSETRCPWCSALVAATAVTCPSCGAALRAAISADAIPGVTSLDPRTAARRPVRRPNRIVTWLAGDLDPLPDPDPSLPLGVAGAPGVAAVPTPDPMEGTTPASYAPPTPEVRREMARLELAAIQAELEARAAEPGIDPTVEGHAVNPNGRDPDAGSPSPTEGADAPGPGEADAGA